MQIIRSTVTNRAGLDSTLSSLRRNHELVHGNASSGTHRYLIEELIYAHLRYIHWISPHTLITMLAHTNFGKFKYLCICSMLDVCIARLRNVFSIFLLGLHFHQRKKTIECETSPTSWMTRFLLFRTQYEFCTRLPWHFFFTDNCMSKYNVRHFIFCKISLASSEEEELGCGSAKNEW